MPNRKVSPKKFAETYVEMKARDKTQKEIADELGVSSRQVRRYLNDDDYVRRVSEIREQPGPEDDVEEELDEDLGEEGAISELEEEIDDRRVELTKEGIEKGKTRAEKCLDVAFKMSIKTSRALLKEYRNYRDHDDFKKRTYALKQLKSSAAQARSTLAVARQELAKEKAVNQLQVNIDQSKGISESDFFGALRYALRPVEDEEIAKTILDRIEEYLQDRDIIEADAEVVESR